MSFHTRAARNRSMPCRVVGCTRLRHAISPYCAAHARRADRWGHPCGRAIRPREYLGERETAARFLAKYQQHAAVVASLSILRNWLERAARGERVPGRRELSRLQGAGVDTMTILRECVALYLFAKQHPHALPDDARLTFALGARVCSLAPFEKRYGTLHGRSRYYVRAPGKVDRREIGERIRETFGALFVNIEARLAEEQAERESIARAMRAPFNPI